MTYQYYRLAVPMPKGKKEKEKKELDLAEEIIFRWDPERNEFQILLNESKRYRWVPWAISGSKETDKGHEYELQIPSGREFLIPPEIKCNRATLSMVSGCDTLGLIVQGPPRKGSLFPPTMSFFLQPVNLALNLQSYFETLPIENIWGASNKSAKPHPKRDERPLLRNQDSVWDSNRKDIRAVKREMDRFEKNSKWWKFGIGNGRKAKQIRDALSNININEVEDVTKVEAIQNALQSHRISRYKYAFFGPEKIATSYTNVQQAMNNPTF